MLEPVANDALNTAEGSGKGVLCAVPGQASACLAPCTCVINYVHTHSPTICASDVICQLPATSKQRLFFAVQVKPPQNHDLQLITELYLLLTTCC